MELKVAESKYTSPIDPLDPLRNIYEPEEIVDKLIHVTGQ
jgi:hypothetical protein